MWLNENLHAKFINVRKFYVKRPKLVLINMPPKIRVIR